MCFVQVYFSQFGAVKDVTILTDHVTQRSRGFGFVVYEDPNSVNAVLSHRYHELDGRKAPRLGRCCASPVTPLGWPARRLQELGPRLHIPEHRFSGSDARFRPCSSPSAVPRLTFFSHVSHRRRSR